ncbi:MAG: HAD-IC family P-type ATPase, partial [Bacillota bacterium]
MKRRQKSTAPPPGAELSGADSLPLSEVFRRLKTSAATGLDPADAAARSMQDGYNDLLHGGGPSALALLWDQIRSFMTLLLIGAALLSYALGEELDALAIAAIVVLNTLLGFGQEYRAERAIEALAQWRAPKARVMRRGQVLEIPAREVALGDILLLEAGDRVPADARLIEAYALQAEESALTGESAPVPKIAAELPPPGAARGAGQASHMVLTGTTVVSGSARAVVVRTGAFTELGRIAAMVSGTPRSDSPLQRSLEHLARWLVGICAVAVALVFAVGVAQGQPWYGMFMVAISLAVAAIPEGLPAAVTAALALGVQRMSRRRAIVRQLSAIETLGCASVICADKTGTLTLNEMTVARIEAPWGSASVSGEGFEPRGSFLVGGRPADPLAIPPLERLLMAGVLCSHGDVAHRGRRWGAVGDPTEAALVCAARKAGLDPPHLRSRHPIVVEAPFEAHRRRMSVAVAASAPRVAEIFVKGAPDAVMSCCRWYQAAGGERALTDRDRAGILARAEGLAGEGLRVLAVAGRRVPRAALPDPGSSIEVVAAALEGDLTFLGLVGLRDPPRPDVPAAIERA